MQFKVPHFLETEQRILGPFTFTNFVIMLGVAGFLVVLYFLGINFILWAIITIITVIITLIFMFGSYNGRPAHSAIVDFFNHLLKRRGRITWGGVVSKESVTEFILTNERLRNLPSTEPKKLSDTDARRISKKIEELSKGLDA